MAKDLYEILGVGKTATGDEIKRAYRKLAQKHHPDRTKGDKTSEEKFKEINGAYEVLSDKTKRQQYDQFGESAFQGGAGGFSGGGGFGGFSGFGENFSDIFETFFGGGSQRSRSSSAPGDDREILLTITFEEAAFGTEKEIKISRIGECETCKGQGNEPGSKIISCITCSGSGEIRRQQNTILGTVTTRRVCDACSGSGKVPERTCSVCNGAGRVRLTEKLRVKIPAGINDDAAMRISGKGDSGTRGSGNGDLYVHIRVASHKLFERKGYDVYCEQEIHLIQAVLGDTIKVDTIHGPVKMAIPSGTDSGKIFRLKEYGIQKLKSSDKGDHFVTIKVKIPKKLSKTERELYHQLAKENGLTLKEEKGFFRKIME